VTSIEIRKKPKKLLSNGRGSIEKTLALRFGKSRIRLVRYAQGKREPELAMAKGGSSDSRRIGRATFEAKNENRTYPDIDGTITERISKQQKGKRHIAEGTPARNTGRTSR
jgi:hypothetical protein